MGVLFEKIVNCVLCICEITERRVYVPQKKGYCKGELTERIHNSSIFWDTVLCVYRKPPQLEIPEHFRRALGENMI